jgi:hypothetical protein
VTPDRRERLATPQGDRIITDLATGIVAGYRSGNLRRFAVAQHICWQVIGESDRRAFQPGGDFQTCGYAQGASVAALCGLVRDR